MNLRRPLALGLALLVGGGGALTITAPAGAARPAKRYPARLLVYAQDFSLTPSRRAVPAGRVTVQLWNRGNTDHDLRIQRTRAAGTTQGELYGPIVGAIKMTSPGSVSTSTWRLKPGLYQLYCAVPGHYAMGMHVVLRVTAGS